MAWSMALKHTQVEIDLITDPDMYLMIESGIRGGIATIYGPYAKANNPLFPDYDPQKPTTYIIYLDANNLYGASQSQSLPVGDFRFLLEQEISNFKLESVPENSPTVCLISCDLEYPDYLHEPHSDYPLAPEHLTVDKDKLSPFAQNLASEHWIPTKKLISNLQVKKRLRHALQKLAVLRRSGPESYQNSQDYFIHSTFLAQTLDRLMH